MTGWTVGLLAVAAAAGLTFLALAIGRRERWDLEGSPGRLRALERAYERTLRTIKDLDYEHQVGILSPAEHARLKAEYKESAVAVRRELDRARQAVVRSLGRGDSARGGAAGLDAGGRQRLEALVARARARLEAKEAR